MNGDVWLGPNAVLAFAREGYSYSDIKIKDLFETLLFPGFLILGVKNMKYGLNEMYNSIFIKGQLKEIGRYVDGITAKDI